MTSAHPCGWCPLPMTGVNFDYSRDQSRFPGRGPTDSTTFRVMEQSIIKAAIIEDQRDIREGLTMLIDGTPGYQCTGSYRSMEEALEKIKAQLPDVVLCDIGLPGMSGIDGIRILKERYPNLQLLMLTVYDDDDRIFDALCAGAC